VVHRIEHVREHGELREHEGAQLPRTAEDAAAGLLRDDAGMIHLIERAEIASVPHRVQRRAHELFRIVAYLRWHRHLLRLALPHRALRLAAQEIARQPRRRAGRRRTLRRLDNIEAELPDHLRRVIDDVLVEDLIVAGDTVRHAEELHAATGRRAVAAEAGIGADDLRTVRRVEADRVVTGP